MLKFMFDVFDVKFGSHSVGSRGRMIKVVRLGAILFLFVLTLLVGVVKKILHEV